MGSLLSFWARAQADLAVYTDNLVNGFQNWSWATVSFTNATPTHTGAHSIRVVNNGNYQALYLQHPNFSTAPYDSLSFWIQGGTNGGQRLTVYGLLNGASQSGQSIGPLPANTWQSITLSLTALGLQNKTNCSGIWIQGNSASAQPAFFVDDIQFHAAPAPALVHLSVNANASVRTAESRWFGLNTAIWDSSFDTVGTSNALRELDCLTLRFPGGSLSDEYHWATGKTLTNTWSWATSWGNFLHVATNARATVFITVNYGTGSSNEAAAWVRSANLTNRCGFKYWEIGNECYGSWETDSNSPAHDPYTYAGRAAGYIALMKAADPSIKIGLVAAPGENSYSNNAAHPATNPRTGKTFNGWTPVLLATLKKLGVTPDFLVHHVYPEYTGTESDPLLLQSANWASDAADLRQQLRDYLGDAGTNVELVCTENNSNSGQQGRQSTSIVNGLYLADSLGQLMKTEFNGFVWWDLRNGHDTNGSFDPALYGWRDYGDLGILSGAATKYPAYYGFKMMQHYLRPGDTVLNATSDYLLLAAYAGRRTNGNLTLLVLNKDATAHLTGQIVLSNYSPSATVLVRSFGIPQDEATRTNGSATAQDIQTNLAAAGSLFNITFPPYSMTLFTFSPLEAAVVAPKFSSPGIVAVTGGWQLSLIAPAGQRFTLLQSGDLTVPVSRWTVLTNGMFGAGPTLVTDQITGAAARFYRMSSP
jgi:alpha-L-arabinofuranosidase